MKISFDDKDDVVVDDISDDLMQAIEQRAVANGRTTEDEMRAILAELCRGQSADLAPESPLP